MKKLFALFLLLFFGLTACETPTTPAAAGTATSVPLITATLPPTATPYASATPIPPSATATVPPISGKTTAPVNVRPAPSLLGQPLGLLPGETIVQINGQNADGTWYRILYDASEDGNGWIAAQYVAVANNASIPIVDTPTPVPAAGEEGNLGRTTQQLNIRSGPGVDYEVLAILPPNTTVTLLGITAGGHWYKIAWEGDEGWVYAPYVETNAANLPVFVPSEDGTATPIPATLTPTPLPAQDDGDDEANPLTGITLDAAHRTALFADDLSAPQGDSSDVIQIVVSSAEEGAVSLLVRLECTGGAPQVTISPLPLAEPLTCNQPFRAIDVLPNRPYLLKLSLQSPDAAMHYVQYTLYVSLP